MPPLLLLTNDGAYAIITLYEGKEVAYARYFCDRTGLSGGSAAAPVCRERFGPDLFRLGAAADRRWQPGRFSDPVRRLRRKRPPHSRVPQAQRRRVHRPKSGAGAGHGTGIREKILWPLAGDRLQPPVFNGFIWRFLFDAAILRDNAITFEGAYLEDELFLMEYFANVHRLAVTDKPLYHYLENPASATHRYMRDYPAVFARFLERKAEIVEKYGLDAARPQWRANTVWAGLLIAVGNEYVKSNPKPVREKRKAVEALCAQPEFAKAIRELRPKGLGRNKQIVADLIGSGRFGTLTALYRLKNHM